MSELQEDLNAKLVRQFSGRVVRKDLTKLMKEGANVPVYVLEYLLGTYCASDDPELVKEGFETVKRVLAENYVRPDEAEKVKSLIREKGRYKVIDRVTVALNEKRDVYEALLSNLGLKGVEVPTATVKKYEKLLAGGIWSIVTMQYYYEEGQKTSPFIVEELKPLAREAGLWNWHHPRLQDGESNRAESHEGREDRKRPIPRIGHQCRERQFQFI